MIKEKNSRYDGKEVKRIIVKMKNRVKNDLRSENVRDVERNKD